MVNSTRLPKKQQVISHMGRFRKDETDKRRMHPPRWHSPMISVGRSMRGSDSSLASSGARNRRRNSRYRTPQDTAPANPVGRSIRSVYCQKDMPAPLIRYMLVGLPIINAMLHVLAATNSETRYGTGSIRALAAK